MRNHPRSSTDNEPSTSQTTPQLAQERRNAARTLALRNETIREQNNTIHELLQRNKKLEELTTEQQRMVADLTLRQKVFEIMAYRYGKHSMGLSEQQIHEDLTLAERALQESKHGTDVELKHG